MHDRARGVDARRRKNDERNIERYARTFRRHALPPQRRRDRDGDRQQHVEREQRAEVPILRLLVQRPPEERRVERPEIDGRVAAREDDVRHERREHHRAEDPRHGDAADLFAPERAGAVLRQRHEAEVARDEEHDGHDEDVNPEDEDGRGEDRLRRVYDVPPLRRVRHVTHRRMEHRHEPDDEPFQIIKKIQTFRRHGKSSLRDAHTAHTRIYIFILASGALRVNFILFPTHFRALYDEYMGKRAGSSHRGVYKFNSVV